MSKEHHFTHKPTGFGKAPDRDRTVSCNGKSLCRVILCSDELWRYFLDWAGIEGHHQAETLEQALEAIKQAYFDSQNLVKRELPDDLVGEASCVCPRCGHFATISQYRNGYVWVSSAPECPASAKCQKEFLIKAGYDKSIKPACPNHPAP